MNRLVCVNLIWVVILVAQAVNGTEPGTISRICKQDPFSLMFIVDVSTSNNESDHDGRRFEVLNQVFDSIYNRCPDALVGISYLSSELYFNPADDLLFSKTADPKYKGAYIPLMNMSDSASGTYTKIDSAGGVVSRIPYAKTGLDVLKMYTQTKLGIFGFMIPDYEPSYVILGGKREPPGAGLLTHITASFEAAKDALNKSPHPKEKHFIVFLSDGYATEPTDNMTERDKYIKGENVPTTFTIYYNPNTSNLQKLQQMTENIKNNGYSESNQKSNIWSMGMQTEAIIELILNTVIEKVPVLIDIPSPTSDRTPTFTWNTFNDSVSQYTIQIAQIEDFSTVIANVPVSDTTFTPVVELPLGTIYWRVKADQSSWSNIGSFEVVDPSYINIKKLVYLDKPLNVKSQVEIYTINGKMIYKGEGYRITDTRIIPSGLYILKTTAGKNHFYNKIMVKN